MHVGGQGISHVTRCVLRGVKRVQNAVERGTGQFVSGMWWMESRARPVAGLVGVIIKKSSVTCKPPLRPRQHINQVEYDMKMSLSPFQ